MESERYGSDQHWEAPAHPKPIDAACKNDIIDFKKEIWEMRKFFLYGVDYHTIDDPMLAQFDKILREFRGKMDEWQRNQYNFTGVLNLPDELLVKITEAGSMIFRARSLLKKKNRTKREDTELFENYQSLSTKAGEIAEKILLEIKDT